MGSGPLGARCSARARRGKHVGADGTQLPSAGRAFLAPSAGGCCWPLPLAGRCASRAPVPPPPVRDVPLPFVTLRHGRTPAPGTAPARRRLSALPFSAPWGFSALGTALPGTGADVAPCKGRSRLLPRDRGGGRARGGVEPRGGVGNTPSVSGRSSWAGRGVAAPFPAAAAGQLTAGRGPTAVSRPGYE